MEKVRVLRLLEYVGTREFVEASLATRSVKGQIIVDGGPNKGSYIREGIIGEFPEILEEEYKE